MATACKFVTLAGADYFLGVVALLNSLRKTGHEQELVVLDRGLTREQRELLEPYATLVRLPEEVAARSLLAKPVFHQYVSADVVVWLDADIIVTGSLERVVDCAAAGTICIYPDDRPSRWFGAWHSAFGLRRPLRPQVYVNAGAFAIRSDRQAQLAPRWEELCASIPVERIFRDVGDPFWAADQDALNALLMSELDEADLTFLPDGEMVFPSALRRVVIDEGTLDARLEGRPVRLLHYAFLAKPWLPSAWSQLRPRDAYLRVLPRLLLGEDVRLRLTPDLVPAWLRLGMRAGLVRDAAFAASLLRRVARGIVAYLPEAVRVRIVAARRRLAPHPRELERLEDVRDAVAGARASSQSEQRAIDDGGCVPVARPTEVG